MSPITHAVCSWVLAEPFVKDRRARWTVVLAGVAPDLDGLGVVVDGANRLLGRPETTWFATQHHWLLHGLFGAMLAVAVSAGLGTRRGLPLTLVFLAVHLHLACDLVGSRGPVPTEIWPIHYFAPFSRAGTVAWSHQWALNAWPNMVFTAALLAWCLWRAVRTGTSPVSLFSPRYDAVVVSRLRFRYAQLFGPGGN